MLKRIEIKKKMIDFRQVKLHNQNYYKLDIDLLLFTGFERAFATTKNVSSWQYYAVCYGRNDISLHGEIRWIQYVNRCNNFTDRK